MHGNEFLNAQTPNCPLGPKHLDPFVKPALAEVSTKVPRIISFNIIFVTWLFLSQKWTVFILNSTNQNGYKCLKMFVNMMVRGKK